MMQDLFNSPYRNFLYVSRFTIDSSFRMADIIISITQM